MRVKSDPSSAPLRLLRLASPAPGFLAAGLIIAALPSPTVAQSAADSASVRTYIEAYRDTWDTHDASAVSALFTEDADMVMGNVPVVHGRQAIRDYWQDYFAMQEPGRHLTLDVIPARFIARDVAIVTVGTTTGGHDPEGRELHARRFRGTWLLQRQGGDWLIAGMRAFPLEEDSVVLNASLEAAEALRPRIRAVVDAYRDAFNAHDPAAVTGFYQDDADIIVRNGPLVHGREAIRDWWRTYFSQPRPYRAVYIIDGIRMITPDVARLNFTVTGAFPASEGEQVPVRYTRATWVIVRDAGQWRISAVWVLPSEDDTIIRVGGGPD
ncbi:MAG: SgcJ/EcaC family oxidoreductase [Gemmatimonadota bacterium]|jgi:uncharacterized protein (TIGR02246 family)